MTRASTPGATSEPTSQPASAQAAAPASAAAAPSAAASPWQPGNRRSREREVKRDAVIRAAARAFNEHGYHNTSLDDLAAALHVTKPTLYYYVRSKEELLFECFRAGVDRIRAAFEAAERMQAPARERLAVVLRGYAEAIASEFGWCMVRVEHQDLSPALSGPINDLKVEVDRRLRQLLAEGVRDGARAVRDPRMAAFALAGALNWIAYWYREDYRGDRPLTPAGIADAFMAEFLQGLLPRP
jgi:AcrR family transcriptional regulator